ncbi:MAG TPA: hypothetical protein VF677_14040 [Flavobacterium sp.]|jgi:hypothetical protein
MTPEEKEYYDNLKDGKIINDFIFEQLFENTGDTVVPRVDKRFRLIGGIPFVSDASITSFMPKIQFQNQNLQSIQIRNNATEAAISPFDKKIIILPFDVNKRGNFSDSFYIQRDLLDFGYGSAGLSKISPEDLDKIGNGEASPFYIDKEVKQNENEAEEYYNKSWLTDAIYNSDDLIMHFVRTKDESGTLLLKMNLKAYNQLKTGSKTYIDTIASGLQPFINESSDYTFSAGKIASVIEGELAAQRQDMENRYDPTVRAFQKHGIREVFYQNKCDNGTLVTVHAYLNSNTISYTYSTLQKAKAASGLDLGNDAFVIYKKYGKWEKSELPIDFLYNNGKCPDSEKVSEEETKDISAKLPEFFKASNLKGNDKILALLDKKLKKLLTNPFYKDVKLAVNIKTYPNNYKIIAANSFENIRQIKAQNDKITKSYYQNCEGVPDITIDIIIDEKGNPIIKNNVNPNYLKEYEDQWKTEAKKRGLKVDIPALREQVKTDLENLAKETDALSFYKKFVQKAKALVSDNIADYVEAIAATQKIAKNVWKEGTVNKSTWHTKEEDHKQWPGYCRFEPTIAGVEDGVIDEIVGIPMAIKGVYEIATDDEKQKALMGMFTSEGMANLYKGLQQEVKDTYNDEEKGKHFVGQTTVSVVSMMAGVGLLTKAKKLDDIVELGTDLEKVIPDAKTTKFLDDFKKADRHVDTDKALKEITEEVGGEGILESIDEIKDLTKFAEKQKNKFTWKELKAFFERGNNFNKKVRDKIPIKYDFHEVTVEQVVNGKVKKYRLDSYNEGLEIVSRKATDFEKIQSSTFEKYLKELVKKYPEGAKITAPKFGNQLKNKVLKGELKIEVPETNKISSRLEEFKKLAEKYKVEIVFEPE